MVGSMNIQICCCISKGREQFIWCFKAKWGPKKPITFQYQMCCTNIFAILKIFHVGCDPFLKDQSYFMKLKLDIIIILLLIKPFKHRIGDSYMCSTTKTSFNQAHLIASEKGNIAVTTLG